MPIRNFSVLVDQLLKEHDIQEPPVDLERIAKSLGIVVEYAKMTDSLSGFLSNKDGVRAIGVNSKHPRNRQRFTLAHEIAHVLLGHDTGEVHVDKGIVLYRNTDSMSATSEIEIEANRLAAELLTPKTMLKADLSDLDAFDAITDDDLEYLAARYAISLSALLNRLRGVGFATERFDPSYERAALSVIDEHTNVPF